MAFLLYSISIIMPFILTACLSKMASHLRPKRGKFVPVPTIQNLGNSKIQSVRLPEPTLHWCTPKYQTTAWTSIVLSKQKAKS